MLCFVLYKLGLTLKSLRNWELPQKERINEDIFVVWNRQFNFSKIVNKPQSVPTQMKTEYLSADTFTIFLLRIHIFNTKMTDLIAKIKLIKIP